MYLLIMYIYIYIYTYIYIYIYIYIYTGAPEHRSTPIGGSGEGAPTIESLHSRFERRLEVALKEKPPWSRVRVARIAAKRSFPGSPPPSRSPPLWGGRRRRRPIITETVQVGANSGPVNVWSPPGICGLVHACPALGHSRNGDREMGERRR